MIETRSYQRKKQDPVIIFEAASVRPICHDGDVSLARIFKFDLEQIINGCHKFLVVAVVCDCYTIGLEVLLPFFYEFFSGKIVTVQSTAQRKIRKLSEETNKQTGKERKKESIVRGQERF